MNLYSTFPEALSSDVNKVTTPKAKAKAKATYLKAKKAFIPDS